MNLLLIQPGMLDEKEDSSPAMNQKTTEAIIRILSEVPITAIYAAPTRWVSELLSHIEINATESPWLGEGSFPGEAEGDWAIPTAEQERREEWDSDLIKQLDAVLEQHGYRREGRQYRAISANSNTLAFLCPFGAACVLLSHFLHLSPVELRNTMVPKSASVFTLVSKEQQGKTATFVMTSFKELP